MNVRDCMSSDVRTIAPDATVQDAARLMKALDAGAIPVGENDRLVGMITDRDIAIRCIADGKGPSTTVREAMTTADLQFIFEDDDLQEASARMSDHKVRRLPVLNREKRLVGIISLGDISLGDVSVSGAALCHVSEPGGPHTQH
jgi:CBS domain-containing protein